MKAGCFVDIDRLCAVKRSTNVCCADRPFVSAINRPKTTAIKTNDNRLLLHLLRFLQQLVPGAVTIGTGVAQFIGTLRKRLHPKRTWLVVMGLQHVAARP